MWTHDITVMVDAFVEAQKSDFGIANAPQSGQQTAAPAAARLRRHCPRAGRKLSEIPDRVYEEGNTAGLPCPPESRLSSLDPTRSSG